jgi:hypothetical protein
MHRLATRVRLLADHGQFYAFDASRDPYDPLPEISDETVRRGWTRNKNAIYYFTVGQLWDIRLDLFESSGCPGLELATRLLSNTLWLPSGTLLVGNPIAEPNLAQLSLNPGEYSLYLRAFNLGAESEEHLADASRLARDDLERYELFVAPGPASSEGVILGTTTLW